MKKEELVRKILKKAQGNGWYSDNEFHIVQYDGSIGTSIRITGYFDDDGTPETWTRDLETLIYQPYFAKSFFGTDSNMVSVGDKGFKSRPGWEYYLQEMVIQKDVIKYLEKFI